MIHMVLLRTLLCEQVKPAVILQTSSWVSAGQSQHIAGEGLVQAMRAVPLEFFAEDFSLQK